MALPRHPLADSKIDLVRECVNGDCAIAKTEQFLAVLKDPKADVIAWDKRRPPEEGMMHEDQRIFGSDERNCAR